MSEPRHYDLIIVGSGAGGATLASQLAKSGKRILILERGTWLPREAENWNSREVYKKRRYETREEWTNIHGGKFSPAQHYNVGGNTKVYGAALFRLRESDFDEQQHEDGISPAWPLKYSTFAPYYLEAEKLYQVHGRRGSDPAEPPETAPYPYPAIEHEPVIAELNAGFERVGAKPFPLPMALHVDEKKPLQSACILCATCDGYPCVLHAKSDADITCIRPTLRSHANVELMTNAKVLRFETDADGRHVRAVKVETKDGVVELEADLFVLSAGAINSSALLLASRSDKHPNGLANGSGLVGRNYMCHVSSAFMMLRARKNPVRFQKTLGLNEWYHPSADGKRPALGHVQMLGKVDGGILESELPPIFPRALLDSIGQHSMDFWLMTEDLPKSENRVGLEADGSIRLDYVANNLKAHARLDREFRKLLTRAQRGDGFHFPDRIYLSRRIPLSGVAHQCGTARFGTDPATSVLDLDCRTHEVENLHVVDGSFFPSAGAVNPTLTIIANALRVADLIAARFA